MKIRGAVMKKDRGLISKKAVELQILLLGGKKGELTIVAPSEILNGFEKNDEIEITIEKIKG